MQNGNGNKHNSSQITKQWPYEQQRKALQANAATKTPRIRQSAGK